jgi:hypothetical protein
VYELYYPCLVNVSGVSDDMKISEFPDTHSFQFTKSSAAWKTKIRWIKIPKRRHLSSALLWAIAMPSFGQVARFTGAVDNSWENGANWTVQSGNPSLPPRETDSVLLNGGTVTLAGDKSVGGVSVSSNPVTLKGLGAPRIIDLPSSFVSPTLSSELTLDGVRLVTSYSPSPFIVKDDMVLVNGGGISTPSDLIFSSEAGNWGITGSGSIQGQVKLSGGNAVSIGSQVELTANSIDAGAGTLVIGSSVSTLYGVVVFTGTEAGVVRNSGSMTVPYLTVDTRPGATSGNIFENTGTFTKTGDGFLTFLPPIFGSSSLLNSGTMRLGGTGLVILANGLHQTAGSLEFAGASVAINSPLFIDGGAVSGELSAVTGPGSVNVSSATLSPGTGPGAVGSLAFPAALNLTGGDLVIDINPVDGADSVIVGGDILLAGGSRLTVEAPEAIAPGTSFQILNGARLTGTFADLGGGNVLIASGAAGQEFRIDYMETGVYLTSVPEPHAAAVLFSLGLLSWAAVSGPRLREARARRNAPWGHA